MRSIDRSGWLCGTWDETDTGILGALYELESKIQRMLVGIVLFVVETLPDFWKRLFNWLLGKIEFLIRASVRLSRIAVLLIAWLVIVFGPAWLMPVWISSGWLMLTISGSIYGLKRAKKHRKPASSTTIILTPRPA